MALLVVNASSKVSQGVLKRLYASGTYEKIIAADLYPNYYAIERFLRFKSELDGIQTKTQLEDIKLSDKSDLLRALKRSSHVVYITHDYYKLTSSKLNLIKTVAEASKTLTQKLVCLTPVEYDHYGEKDPIFAATKAENEAKTKNPDIVHLKSDITFGDKSEVVNSVLKRIVQGKSVNFKPIVSGETTAPIHTDDVAAIVELALKDDSFKGKSFILEGKDRITLGELLSVLQKHVGKQINLNSSIVETIIPPYNANLISEYIYCPSYANLTGLFREYRTLERGGFSDASEFKVNLHGLSETYKENGVDESKFKPKETSALEEFIKARLY